MMDDYYGDSWLLFNSAWEGVEDANQSVWLVKPSPAHTSKARMKTVCYCDLFQ